MPNDKSNLPSRQACHHPSQVRSDPLICIPSRISDSMSFPGNAPFPSPSAASPSFSDTWVPSDLYGMSMLRPSASPGLSGTVEPSTLPPENFSNVPGAGTHFQWAMQPTGPTDQDAAVKREHLAYYFNHVRGLQFLFTCKVALDAIQSVSTGLNADLYVKTPDTKPRLFCERRLERVR
jgi:hypothetical protein